MRLYINELKFTFTLIVLIFLITNTKAQKNTDKLSSEIYITINSLTSGTFGVQYKKEIKKDTYFNLSILQLTSDYKKTQPGTSLTAPTSEFTFQGEFSIGIEKRRKITDVMSINYGSNLIGSSVFQRLKIDAPQLTEDQRINKNLNIFPGIGINTGIILNIKNDFYLSAELIPKLSYFYTASDNSYEGSNKDKTKRLIFDLNSESVKLSLVYKWN